MKVGIVKETQRFGGKQGARGNKCEFHKYRINRILRDFYSENMLRMRQEQGFYHNKGRRNCKFFSIVDITQQLTRDTNLNEKN